MNWIQLIQERKKVRVCIKYKPVMIFDNFKYNIVPKKINFCHYDKKGWMQIISTILDI